MARRLALLERGPPVRYDYTPVAEAPCQHHWVLSPVTFNHDGYTVMEFQCSECWATEYATSHTQLRLRG